MNVPSSPQRSPLLRVLGIAVVAGALTQLILLTAAGAGGRPLDPGHPVERGIAEGETHVYEIAVPADHVVNGVVDQRGIDVMVRVVDPSGVTVATLDSPNGTKGPEPWSIEAKVAGTWRIEISPFPGAPKPGRYEARIDEVITTDERDERVARARYASPRLRRLWKEQRAEGAAAIDRFAKEMEGHSPLVEPIADDPRGDVLITFPWRGPRETPDVDLLLGPTGGMRHTALDPFEGSDLRTLTVRVPRTARFTYVLRAGDPQPAFLTWEAGQTFFAHLLVDPWNPLHFGSSSLVELPAAPAQIEAQPDPRVTRGSVVARTLHSAILDEDRAVGVYLPAGFDPHGGPYPYVIAFDGEGFRKAPPAEFATPTILDNLIAAKKIPPTVAVFIDSQGTRNRDLPMSAPFSDFVARELAPWVRHEYRAAEDPRKATVAGASFGGLCAVYTAFHHADVFGNASRSPARSGSRQAPSRPRARSPSRPAR